MKEKIKVLIADDIYANQFLLAAIIDELGGMFKTVCNGKEVLDELEKNNYHIVLLDIEMPVMNGIETVKAIRNHKLEKINKLPVIALTAHNPDDFGKLMDNAGFNQLITKPYSVEKISELIKKIIL